MSYRQYIGARYVPKFADPIEWNDQTLYEGLTVVLYNLGYYTSRKNVPVGVPPTNDEYWVLTGNYSAQIQELINKFPVETSDLANGAVTFAKLDDDIIPVYNAEMYGAVGDANTDNWQTLQNLVTLIKENGGGVLYIPDGQFNISRTLVIADNVKLIGNGESSIIYHTNYNDFGVGILVVGSNTLIKDIKINYINPQPTPSLTSGNYGAVGVSSYDYYQSIGSDEVTVFHDYDNIVIDNLTTDGWYPIQTEPTQGKVISNVTYRNMNFSHDCLVSILGKTLNGVVRDVNIDNVNGGYLRVAGNDNAYNININNCVFNYGAIKASNVNATNLVFDASEDSIFDNINFNYILDISIGNQVLEKMNFTNLSVDGGNKKNIGINTSTTTRANFVNVKTKDCLTHGIAGAIGEEIFIVNGDFSTANGQVNTVVASGINVKGSTQNTNLSRYVFDDTLALYILPSTVSFLQHLPNNIYTNGNIVKVTVGVSATAFATNSVVVRVQCPPKVAKNLIGYLKTSDGIIPVILNIDTDGVIKLVSSLDGDTTVRGTEVYIDTCYTVSSYA